MSSNIKLQFFSLRKQLHSCCFNTSGA